MKKFKILTLILFVILMVMLSYTVILNAKHVSNSQTGLNKSNNKSLTHRFVFIADTRGINNGVNEKILSKTFQQIKQLNPQPEYIIVGGDLVSGSDKVDEYKKQLLNFKRIASLYYSPKMILPTLGNHEVSGGADDLEREKIFGETFSEFVPTAKLDNYNKTAYYVDDGNVRLIVLNSFHSGQYNQILQSQLDWLKQVSKPKGKLRFVFVHSPAYPTGAHVGSSLDEYPKQRDKFWQVIDQNDVMALFSGHEHNYSRRLIDNTFSTKDTVFNRQVYQIVAGSAGAPLYKQYTSKKGVVVAPKPVYHYAVLDIGKDNTAIKAFSVDGQVIDSFSLKNVY